MDNYPLVLSTGPEPPLVGPPAGEHGADGAPAVGAHLRRLRSRRGLSLQRLAQRSGVSRAMLSQIELGQSAPTITVLWKIARALEVGMTTLIGRSDQITPRVLRAADARRLVSPDGGFTSRALFPTEQPRRSELYELRLKARAQESALPRPTGAVENLVVTAGSVEVIIEGAAHRLDAGDAMVFPGDVPRGYRNLGAVEAVLYLVTTYAEEIA